MTIVASAILLSGVAPSLAANRPARTSKCSSIYAVCLQRAEGHAAICEDMYRSAVSNGYWQATEEPDGTKHPAVPCTK
jgi:hypothetical protein